MKKTGMQQQGFTLIELMIVVAIVAILAAIALPFYANFTYRAKMSEVAAAIDACKVSVIDYHEAESAWPSNASTAGCFSGATQYVTSIAVAVNGTFVEIEACGAGDVAGCGLRLTSTDAVGSGWEGSHDGGNDPTTGCEGQPGRVPPLFRPVINGVCGF